MPESFAGYLARWQAHEQKVRTWHDRVRMQYPRSIAVTWDTSFVDTYEVFTPGVGATGNWVLGSLVQVQVGLNNYRELLEAKRTLPRRPLVAR